MPDSRNFKVGDKVLVEGLPYSFSTTKARVISAPEKTDDGHWVVGVRYWDMGFEYRVVSIGRIVKVKGMKVKLTKPARTALIVGVLVALFGFWFAGNYNDLVRARNQLNNSHARIDTALERRYELIDNLVGSVKGAQGQEQEVFGAIANARKQATQSKGSSGEAAANTQLDTQIALLPRLQENYPELKSNDQVSKLITDLENISVEVRDARNNYNDTATNYNNNVTSFPKNIFAGIFNFHQADLFKADAAAEKNPKVDFGKYGNGTEDNSQQNQSN